MKRIVIIVLLIAMVGGMVLVPMFNKKDVEQPVSFDFKENLATPWNTQIPLSFTVFSDEVEKVEIYFEDSLVRTFSNPRGQQKFQLNAGYFGLGTRALNLKAKLSDGTNFEDNRLLRVLSDIAPAVWKIEIQKTLTHNSENFTQGLEFDGNTLYESTGDPDRVGNTKLGPIDMNSGQFTKKIGLDANYFGEGITILKDKIYQLTYTQGKCFVYDKHTLQLIKEFTYPGEGWGLCNDGTHLYMSNGTERIVKRDPKTFEVIETIEVFDNRGPVKNLNELEFVNGQIYANIWMTPAVIAFQPENGKVLAVMDASQLVSTGAGNGDVLNGIAYQKSSDRFYMTGKYWPKMFEVRINKDLP